MKISKPLSILLLVIFVLLPISVTAQTLPPSDWWAWIYIPQADKLHLINASGEQAEISRPTMPGEAPYVQANPQIAASPDGRYLVLSARLSNGKVGLGFYSLEARRFVQTHETQPGEDIILGGTTPFAGAPTAFSPNGDRVAIGFAAPAINNWRVIIFEVETGNWLYLVDHAQVNTLGVAFSGIPMYPRIMYYAADGSVHTQLVPYNTPSSERNPAFAWNPELGSLQPSPYEMARMDINIETGIGIFATVDSLAPTLPPIAPFGAFNAIGMGIDSADEILWTDGTQYHYNAHWAAGDDLVLFQTQAPNETDSQWNALQVTSQNTTSLDTSIRAAYPLPDGFLSVTESGGISYHSAANPAVGNSLWQFPGITEVYIVWTSQPNSPFTLRDIPPEPDAMVITDRLNVRQNPGEGAVILGVVGRDNPLNVVGRLPDNSWIQVTIPSGLTGWVARNLIRLNVDLATVPVVNTRIIFPPTPTVDLPVIEYFLVDDSYIQPGSCATLSWAVSGATLVTLNHNQQGQIGREPVPARGTQLVCPTSFTFYTLTADSVVGSVSSHAIQIYVGAGY